MTLCKPYEIATITVLSDRSAVIQGTNIASDRDVIIDALEKALGWLCDQSMSPAGDWAVDP